MLTREQAEEVARSQIEEIGRGVRGGVALMPQSTIEKPYGWVFFFNSKRFVETGDVFWALGGNSPILVEAESGRITLLGTATSVHDSLARFELDSGFSRMP